MGDRTSQGTTHDLLLALAGRVDDDLLNWARELVAVGEDARAVEMLTASLVAARAVLPGPLREALVAAARVARTDLGPAAALPAPRDEDGTEHRFTTPHDDDPVATTLRGLPARTLAGCRVLLTRRVTPAGTAPGPLPHPVVIVQLPGTARPAEVLAYQLAAALERAGSSGSVEVLAAHGPLSDYHAAALDNAVLLRTDDGEPLQPVATDDTAATAVLPTTTQAPVQRPTPGPAPERHVLAAQPAGPPSRADDEPPAWQPDPEPAPQHPGEETSPAAPLDHRRTPAPSPRPVGDDVASTHRLDRFPLAEQNGRPRGGASAADDHPVPGREHEPVTPPREQWNATVDEDGPAAVGRPDGDGTGHDDPRDGNHDDLGDDYRGESRSGYHQDDHSRDELRNTWPNDVPVLPRDDRPLRGVDGYADHGDHGDHGDHHDHHDHHDGDNHRDNHRDDEDDWREDDVADDIRDDRRDYIRDDRRDEERPLVRGDEPPAGPPSPHPLAPPRPVPVRDETRPAPRPAPTTRPRPTVMPISRTPVPPPIPLVRRTGPHPAPRPLPVTEPRPTVRRLDDDRDQDPPPDAGPAETAFGAAPDRAQRPPQKPDASERRETPAFNSLSDPLIGPLHQPLLDPLLDPTVHDDPLGLDARGPAPAAEPEPDDEWSQEWLSGTWAMAPSALDEQPDRNGQDPRSTGESDEHAEPPDHPAPRPAPRHRFAGDQGVAEDAGGEDDRGSADADEYDADEYDPDEYDADEYDPEDPEDGTDRPERVDDGHVDDGHDDDRHDRPNDHRDTAGDRAPTRAGPGTDRPELGLRPESLARLSDADRQLLARLQAELVEGRKPRLSRRPDLARGAGPMTNGSRRSTPPDLAG
jgi:hypothetical protein